MLVDERTGQRGVVGGGLWGSTSSERTVSDNRYYVKLAPWTFPQVRHRFRPSASGGVHKTGRPRMDMRPLTPVLTVRTVPPGADFHPARNPPQRPVGGGKP